MAFNAAALSALENALSEAFKYHRELDTFLTRSGVSSAHLKTARDQAESRPRSAAFASNVAPKRFVAQETLSVLALQGDDGDRIVAALITALCKGSFPNASPLGLEAISALQNQTKDDQARKQAAKQEAEDIERTKTRTIERKREEQAADRQNQREGLLQRFMILSGEQNPQTRGFQLEPFMNDLFEFEGLNPRSSFRLISASEQIDGSIIWRGRSNFVEVKWVKEPVAGKEFGAFLFKIEGKSADTRGLFLSINGYSPGAIEGLNRKGALKFVCLDGTHIVRALTPGQTLASVLQEVWRHADETGEAYLPASRMKNI
jgi:Arc/MetJ-type ribon-helix-helix transcriptional regulator